MGLVMSQCGMEYRWQDYMSMTWYSGRLTEISHLCSSGRWPDGGLSEGYGHDGPGVCLGDGQTEAYRKDTGMVGLASVWAMARRRLKEYRHKINAATRWSDICPHT